MSANNPKSDEAHTPASRTKNTEYNHVSGILSTDNTQSYEAHTSAIGTEHDESSTEDDESSTEDDESSTKDDESSSEHDESPPELDESKPDTGGFDFRNYNPWGTIVSHSKKPGYDPLGAVFTPAQITVEDGDEEPLPHWYQPHFRLRHMILEACDEAEIIFRDTSIKDGERALFHFGMSERALRKKVPRKHTIPVSKEWHLAWCEKHLLPAQTHFGNARDSFQAANIAMTLVYKSALAAMDAPSLDEIESRQGRPDGQPPSKQSGEAIAEHRDDLNTTDCGVSETEQSQGNPATALLNTVGPAPVKKHDTVGPAPVKKHERGDGEDTTGLDDEPSRKKARMYLETENSQLESVLSLLDSNQSDDARYILDDLMKEKANYHQLDEFETVRVIRDMQIPQGMIDAAAESLKEIIEVNKGKIDRVALFTAISV